MRAFLLVFSLHVGGDHGGGDHWFAADKAKHFFTAAFVQSVAFGAFRAAGATRAASLGGATAVSSLVSVGKELYDRRTGGDASAKDLVWDAAGIIAASVALNQTRR